MRAPEGEKTAAELYRFESERSGDTSGDGTRGFAHVDDQVDAITLCYRRRLGGDSSSRRIADAERLAESIKT